ncbi:MAG: type II TA system antitoxin MqsA family protein [Gemmatimonadaceae bacterium]
MENITTLNVNECSLCGGTVGPIRESVDVRIGERAVAVDFTHRKCDTCGEVFHRPEELRELRREAAAKLRHEDGLLSPDELRALRASLGISQATQDLLIHAGRKTTARWEAGTVCQSGAADTLLRVLREVPQAVAFLGQLRGIPISATVPMPPPLDPKIIHIEPHLQRRAQEAGLRRFDSDTDGKPPVEAIR